MKIYEVVHFFDVDGGYGDAVPESEVIYRFSSKDEAEKVVEKYNNPHVYAKPYDELECGELAIIEKDIYETANEVIENIEETINKHGRVPWDLD